MMPLNRFRKDQGFTLIEILFAVFIGLLLLTAVYVTMISGQKSSGAIERKVAAQQDVRGAVQLMAMEIGMASFNPTFQTGIWRNPTTCALAAAPEQIRKGIQEATPTTLAVEMDSFPTPPDNHPNGTIGPPDSNEIIRYEWLIGAAGQRITRETNCGGAQAFLGDDPNAIPPRPRTVRVINEQLGIINPNGQPAVFRYWNGKNPPGELYPDVTPADIPNIRRIDITLGVETDEIAPDTGQRRRMIYSTTVLVRNHVLSP